MASPSINSRTSPWTTFRVLCKYYADCIVASERPQEVLYHNGEGDKFATLTLPSGWLRDAEAGLAIELDIDVSSNKLFLKTLATTQTQDETIYVGYPLQLFRKKGTKGMPYVSPIFIIPVSVEEQTIGHYKIQFHLDEAKLNSAWLDYNVTPERRQLLMRQIIRGDLDDQGVKGLFDIGMFCAYIEKHKAKCTFNPAQAKGVIDWRMADVAQNEYRNVAILATGEQLRYAKTLHRELLSIREVDDATLDQTALAYIFREPPLPNQHDEGVPKHYPTSFIETNLEQFRALLRAMNMPLSQVQGPPGTGKSQVAVNLLTNLLYQGQSVLFTSKNHKAVHAIADKLVDALVGETPPESAHRYVTLAGSLARFCADDSGTAVCSWEKPDLMDGYRELQGLAEVDVKVRLEAEQQELDHALEDLSCVWSDLENRQKWTRILEDCETTIASIQNPLSLPDGKTVSYFRSQLEFLKKVKPTGWLKALFWKLLKTAIRQEQTEKRLRETFPEVYALTREIFVRRLSEGLDKLVQLKEAQQALEVAKEDVARLPSYEAISQSALRARLSCREHQRDAFLSRLYHTMKNTTTEGKQHLYRLNRQLFRAYNRALVATDLASLTRDIRESFKREILTFNPAWVVTLLSLHRASPCCPALFDHVIIDEAAQCDVPPIIPALFRARHVTIIGDPEQFPPVIDLHPLTHNLILERNGLTESGTQPTTLREAYETYNFRKQTAYSITRMKGSLLTEHFRCAGDIANYFNQTFYKGKLHMCSPNEARSLALLKAWNRKRAIDWIDVPNNLEREQNEVKKTLDTLANVRLNGRVPTVGVIVPAKKIAESIRERLAPHRKTYQGMLDLNSHISTVNGFQGGERDIILLVLGVNASTPRGDLWYATTPEHAYIYNVAVSRAKLCCVVIGDRAFVANLTTCPPLQKLATYETPAPTDPKIGPGEIALLRALEALGLHPETQYPVLNRRLDLAFPAKKLDVEVDGVKFHVNKYGDRKSDDIFRDEQLAIKGWETFRVWHYEVMNDANAVAMQIKKLLDSMPILSPSESGV